MPSDSARCGRYVLEREIARGGMGAIWAGWDPQLKRRVAIKRLPGGVVAPAALARFEYEAAAVARLSHPNVVQVHDYGVDEGHPYIVMELLDGEDLDTRLRRVGTLSIRAAVPIVQQMANALSAAHAAGIVHRDLKPANIFLARSDSGETVKLLDFGVATALGASSQGTSPTTAVLVGTPAYMSPEQARGQPVDHRSDIWSAAVVAYAMLTGGPPFMKALLSDLIGAICADVIPAPSARRPPLDRSVDELFQRALARDPKNRFQSAAELAAAFSALEDASSARSPKILLVDDEPDMGLLLTQWLQQSAGLSGYELLLAESGEQALALLRMHPDVDVVLSDIRMPGMDGLALLHAVPEIAPMAKVIMVSAYGDMTNIRLAMNRGAFDFLFKPLDFQDLDATLEKALRQVEQTRKVVRAAEDNQLLRLFIQGGVLDRMLPLVRVASAGGQAVVGTVALFDLCGSAQVVRDEPPEKAMAILNAAMEVVVAEIVAQSGVIEGFVGDAALALFVGSDHEAQAASAALAARDALLARAEKLVEGSPHSIGLTVGIESGELIAGVIGSKPLCRRESVLLGDAIAMASRLEVLANKNEILAGAKAYPALQSRFKCAPRPPETPDAPESYRVLAIARTAKDAAPFEPTVVMTEHAQSIRSA